MLEVMLPGLVALVAPLTVAAPTSTSYSVAVHEYLTRAMPVWVKRSAASLRYSAEAVVVVEMEISGTGDVDRLGLARSSGKNPIDDLLRNFILAAEPFPPPPADALTDGRTASCLARIEVGDRALDAAVACFPPGQTTAAITGLSAKAGTRSDPGARLFSGWVNEAAGNDTDAATFYDLAVQAAPGWDLAARSLGMALVKAGRDTDAMPHLEVYMRARAAPADVSLFAREMKRYAKHEGDSSKPRARLDRRDVAAGIQDGIATLDVCLEGARAERLLRVGNDTLTVSFKIRKDGSAYGTRLQGPESLVMTGHGECIEAAIDRWSFPPYSEGEELTVTRVPIGVRGCDEAAPEPDRTVAVADTGPAPTPSMSVCQRDQSEIGIFIRKTFPELTRCVQQERRRAPRVPLPPIMPIGFVIAGEGTIRGIEVKHRAYREGPFNECVQRALAGVLSAVGGADCPAQFDLNVPDLPPER